jgi:hypothetical protein
VFIQQVGILGNAADFFEDGSYSGSMDNMDRRQMMIAFDMRYGHYILHLKKLLIILLTKEKDFCPLAKNWTLFQKASKSFITAYNYLKNRF